MLRKLNLPLRERESFPCCSWQFGRLGAFSFECGGDWKKLREAAWCGLGVLPCGAGQSFVCPAAFVSGPVAAHCGRTTMDRERPAWPEAPSEPLLHDCFKWSLKVNQANELAEQESSLALSRLPPLVQCSAVQSSHWRLNRFALLRASEALLRSPSNGRPLCCVRASAGRAQHSGAWTACERQSAGCVEARALSARRRFFMDCLKLNLLSGGQLELDFHFFFFFFVQF